MSDNYYSPCCPFCGHMGDMSELDVIPGHAVIDTIEEDGSLNFSGETEMQWDDQYPEHDPPLFICGKCYKVCTLSDMLEASKRGGKLDS